jgi:DNA polymerase-4
MRTILVQQAGQICANLARRQMAARTLTLKVRYPDFVTVTRSHTPRVPILGPEDIAPRLGRLLGTPRANYRGVRLLGLSLAGLVPCHDLPRQLHLPWGTSGAGSTVPCPDCCHVQPDFR